MSDFKQMLFARQEQGAHLCVGLDPKLPIDGVMPGKRGRLSEGGQYTLRRYLTRIIQASAPYAAAFKPNFGFYLQFGASGLVVLEWIVDYIRDNHPDIAIILDPKWGDIGNTNDTYVTYAENLEVDAITVHNYMGKTGMTPFLEKFFCFVLCRTSNPDSDEFQAVDTSPWVVYTSGTTYPTELAASMVVPGGRIEEVSMPGFLNVANRVYRVWDKVGQGAGLVVGATYPDELEVVDQETEDLIFLIPGVGTQGGTVEEVIDRVRYNTPLINVSSGISKASDPGAAAKKYNDEIRKLVTV